MLVISVTVTTTNGYYITLNKALATYASPKGPSRNDVIVWGEGGCQPKDDEK